MGHPMTHAQSSVRKFGGKPEDYVDIHHWFDATKAWYPKMSHRAIRHHAEGIYECEEKFGKSFKNSDGKEVYTRYVAEQHVIEDLGFIPTAQDWFQHLELQSWMMNRDENVKKLRKPGEKLPGSILSQVSEENMKQAKENFNSDLSNLALF